MSTTPGGERRLLGRAGEAFGDRTRRALYQHVVESNEPLSAGELAALFGIHRTVARSHLERLVEVGLLEVMTRRHLRGGRPAKVYYPSADRFELLLPPRHYETLATLLLHVVGQLPAEAGVGELARRAGFEQGRAVAREWGASREVSHHSCAEAADWLNTHGYRVRVDDGGDGVVALELANCVYREAAELSPEVVCGYDCAFIGGLAGAPNGVHALTSSLVAGDDVCRHEFAV